jgi:hypothetical protein
MKRYSTGWLALFLILIISCQKEKSFEVGNNPSKGSLQSAITGDCLPKTVNGSYVAGTALVPATNTITVSVDVKKTGIYTVYTDTVNGYFFRSTGIFIKTGVTAVTLRSNGTPFATGVNNFVVNYDSTTCDIAVTVTNTPPAVFTLEGAPGNCTGAVVSGSYATANTLNFTNTVKISVNVTTKGTYAITTTKNGMTFSAAGTFTATGVQPVTLVGTGTPTVNGDNIVPITVGATTCNFTVPVGTPAVGFLGGTPGSCTPANVSGTYTVGTALVSAANTVQIQVNVTTLGVYSIATNTVNGISFAASGSFTVLGAQALTLNGIGTPTAGGTQNFIVTFGTSSCNFNVPVNGPAGAAVFSANCAGATVNGTYKAGTPLTAANTIILPVNVTTAGTYNISTMLTNGMIFTGTGTLALGAGSITLSGNGSTPTAAASPSNIPMPGTPSCNVPVTVTAAAGGAAVYAPDCSLPNIQGLYEATTQLNVSNVIDISVNVTTAGTYSFSIPAVNGMTFTSSGTFTTTGPNIIRLTGSGTPVSSGSFSITVPGTPSCTFQLAVDPIPVVDWKFTVTNPAPSITYQGQNDLAQLQLSGGFLVFAMSGSNSDGTDDFLIGFTDANTINAGETYSTTTAAAFSYAPVTVNGIPSADPYVASPTTTGVSVTFTVDSHIIATKTITGRFNGTAKNTAGQIITITNGAFTALYQ